MLTSHLQHGLPPARHQSLSSTVAMRTTSTNSALRPSTAGIAQTRSHWGWRRPGDYASHIDPMFHRFTRYRSIKTRAKQLDKLRRRSRWDWDASQRPFFNAKHIRFASHFGSPKYHPRKLENDSKKSNHHDVAEEDGFELTEGEKEWKEQMRLLRKRIEQDPYEAVFGKRFQPFWSPLLSPLARWTREELGLTDSATDTKPSSNGSKKTPEPAKSDRPAKKDRDIGSDTPNGQLTNYSYSASTAWDSRTNRTRRQEWDSISGLTKTFEYDPVSNKMIQVQVQESQSSSSPQATVPLTPSSNVKSEPKSSVALQEEPRKAIEVPTTNMDESNKVTPYLPSMSNSSAAASPAKTSAITKAVENDLDFLTAEDIRASMRGRHDRAHYSTRSGKSKSEPLQPALQRMPAKEVSEVVEPDDSAAHESTGDGVLPSNVPRDWDKQADILQSNRILRRHGSLHDNEVTRTPADNDPTYTAAGFKPPTVYTNGRKVEEDGRIIDEHERTPADNDPTLDRFARFQPPTVYMNGRKVEENGRKIEIDELARTPYDNDPTMDQADGKFKPPTVYRNGRKVEEHGRMIDDDEYRPRTPYDNDPTMDRSAKFEPPTVYMNRKSINDTAADNHSKYQKKIADLKRDLNLSYEQSTINSEMHVERIKELELALKKARNKKPANVKGPEHVQAEGDFDVANVTKYAKDSSKWYKQPAMTAASQESLLGLSRPTPPTPVVSRDAVMYDALAKTEREYGISYNEATEKDTTDLLKEMAEKDRQISESRAGRNPFPDPLSAKVGKETAEKFKYKPEDTTKLLADYAEQDRQVRESRAGRNPFPDPLSTKVDKEMAVKYEYKPEDTTKLLADYAEHDRQIRESRAGRNPFPDPLSAKVDKEMAEKYKFKPGDTTKLLEADAQREKEWAEYVAKKEANVTKPTIESKKDAASWNIKWAEPPVYKVLAYDSGNDMFSTATTSSNFTTHESPISIQDALSQLYQPARFVPHFAELEKDGYQVIYGTKDLLLFKKRVDVNPSQVNHSSMKSTDTQAEPLTTLVEPLSNATPIGGTVTKEDGKPSYVSPGCPNRKARAPANAENKGQAVRANINTLREALHNTAKAEDEGSSARGTVGDLRERLQDTQSPRVHREERVFSGRKQGGRNRSELTAEEIELLRKLKGNGSGWGSRLRWALGVGVGASAVAYGVGVAVEKKEIRDRERWEDVLEGRYGRRGS